MQNIIPLLIATVAIATVLNVFLKRFNMPTVIGYIFTGVIIGRIFNLDVHGNASLEHIAEFGVVFLMFTIGLEFSVSHLKSMKKEVFFYGFSQVFITGIVLAIASNILFDVAFKTAIIAGLGLTLSSTAIVLKILNESGQINTDYGRNSLGILIFQDIAVIPILLMITIFTNDDKSLSTLLIETTIDAVIALFILIVIGKYIVAYFFKIVASTNSKEIYMGTILLVVVGSSYIAYYFGFSNSLGAFIAGMMIADTIYKYQVEADLIPFRDLLLGVFFVSIGLQIDLSVIQQNIVPVILFAILIMIVKATTTFLILIFTCSKKTSLQTAITLSEIGEFSLVVFSLLLANKMMEPVSVQILMATIVLSMIATPILINNLDKIISLFIKITIEEETLNKSSVIGGHIILCGYGLFGRVVSDKLDRAGINHIIITNVTDDFVKAKEAARSVVYGDPTDRILLEHLRIKKAMSTIIALESLDEIQKVSAAISLIDSSLKIIAKVSSEDDKNDLDQFNHELLLDGNSHIATVLVEQIIKSRMLAKETSSLQFLQSYSLDDPVSAIESVTQEQARLLDVISKSFNALREEKDIMHIKAFHDSFKVLSEIITNAITNIMTNASLSSESYERVNTLLDNQHLLISMNDSLEILGRELKGLEKNDKTKNLTHMAIEGLDTILLTLQDIASNYDEQDMNMLSDITHSEARGLASIRKKYLDSNLDLDLETKALLLSSTNHMESLRNIFGSIGENYKTLENINLNKY